MTREECLQRLEGHFDNGSKYSVYYTINRMFDEHEAQIADLEAHIERQGERIRYLEKQLQAHYEESH